MNRDAARTFALVLGLEQPTTSTEEQLRDMCQAFLAVDTELTNYVDNDLLEQVQKLEAENAGLKAECESYCAALVRGEDRDRLHELEAENASLRVAATVPSHYVSNGEAGDGQTQCDFCGTEVDDDSEHTWLVCIARVQENDRDAYAQVEAYRSEQLAELEARLCSPRSRLGAYLAASELHGWGIRGDSGEVFLTDSGYREKPVTDEAIRIAMDRFDVERASYAKCFARWHNNHDELTIALRRMDPEHPDLTLERKKEILMGALPEISNFVVAVCAHNVSDILEGGLALARKLSRGNPE